MESFTSKKRLKFAVDFIEYEKQPSSNEKKKLWKQLCYKKKRTRGKTTEKDIGK